MPLDEVGALVTHRLMPRGKFKSVVREGGCEEQLWSIRLWKSAKMLHPSPLPPF